MYRQQQWRPLMYSLPNILYMFSCGSVKDCDQLLWINGYSCVHMLSYYEEVQTHPLNLFQYALLKYFLRWQFIKNISDPAQVPTQGVGRDVWRLLTQQADEQLNFESYRQKLLAGKEKENSQIFNEDFCLPLYLPLWSKIWNLNLRTFLWLNPW